MNRTSQILHEPEQYLNEDETLIYFSNGKMIFQTFEGEDLVQVEGKLDERFPQIIKSILGNE